jgi:CheY-like chemotaxis protein
MEKTLKAHPINILMVDDDEDYRLLFKEALLDSKINATLTTAINCNEALQQLRSAPLPDIVFLDINMPCRSGKECLREMRDNEAFVNIPVVMFSVSLNKRDINETFEEGANLYVCKRMFFDNEVLFLKQIFCPGWRQQLLQHDKDRFWMQLTNAA